MKPASHVPHATIRYGLAESSLGSILVAVSGAGVCAILLGDDTAALRRDLAHRFPAATLVDDGSSIKHPLAKVRRFIEHPEVPLELPLDVRGTEFQRRVWKALLDIPAGSTASYADIANRLGEPHAVRAIAQACAANSIAVAIPCHRVIRSDGALSGYRWGVERKRSLLERERAHA